MGVTKYVHFYDWVELILASFTLVWYSLRNHEIYKDLPLSTYKETQMSKNLAVSFWGLSIIAEVRIVLAFCSLVWFKSRGASFVIMKSRLVLHFASLFDPFLMIEYGYCCEDIVPVLASVVPYAVLTPFYYWPALVMI